MKKGFTLVELLAVLAILAVIIVVAGTSYSKISKKNKSQQCKNYEIQIKNAALEYFEEHYDSDDYDDKVLYIEDEKDICLQNTGTKCDCIKESVRKIVNGVNKTIINYTINCNIYFKDLINNSYINEMDKENLNVFFNGLSFDNSYVIFSNSFEGPSYNNKYQYSASDIKFIGENNEELLCN